VNQFTFEPDFFSKFAECRGRSVGPERAMDHKVKDHDVKDHDVKAWPEKAWPENGRPSEAGEQDWLSMLIRAMEQVSRAECRAEPCDAPMLARLRLQLARPVALSTQSADASEPDE